jgi:hypothetical protein
LTQAGGQKLKVRSRNPEIGLKRETENGKKQTTMKRKNGKGNARDTQRRQDLFLFEGHQARSFLRAGIGDCRLFLRALILCQRNGKLFEFAVKG